MICDIENSVIEARCNRCMYTSINKRIHNSNYQRGYILTYKCSNCKKISDHLIIRVWIYEEKCSCTIN